jgi:hypothetical protein
VKACFDRVPEEQQQSGVMGVTERLLAMLPSMIKLDPKSFPRTEWAAVFVTALEHLGPSAARNAARAAELLYPAGTDTDVDQKMKQRLLDQK